MKIPFNFINKMVLVSPLLLAASLGDLGMVLVEGFLQDFPHFLSFVLSLGMMLFAIAFASFGIFVGITVDIEGNDLGLDRRVISMKEVSVVYKNTFRTKVVLKKSGFDVLRQFVIDGKGRFKWEENED